ncbi:MAG: glycosyltransferase family 4 protein [Rhizobiaceae bacterium]|nr:glycosyltransferase family 4 protein [Rhizobiaceae bacterium]
MRIAFYAPLKSPRHSIPSGDRLMARLLMEALGLAGHTVDLVSEFRSFQANPDTGSYALLKAEGEAEIARINARWIAEGVPDLWFSYHPYYKAPDLIGPRLSARFGIRYVTAEASWSPRRFVGSWAAAQDYVLAALRQASLNICFTRRDRDGLQQMASTYRLAMLPPFIDTGKFGAPAAGNDTPRLLSVAMMRSGDKFESYRLLGEALRRCVDLPWTYTIVGDGPMRGAVEAAMSDLPAERLTWLGERPQDEIPSILAGGDLLVWPGFGEAYGLAYLEAQAAGVPVVAQDTAGVPEVVHDGTSGLLTPVDDAAAYAAAVRRLLLDARLRRELGGKARAFVFEERSLPRAASTLNALLSRFDT